MRYQAHAEQCEQFHTLILIQIVLEVIHLYLSIVYLLEYCNGSPFSPHCADNEIIVMQFAKYGRMKLGKCLHSDLGYLGCSSDVLAQFDEQCSGKRTCEIWATDRHITAVGGCMHGLLRYLEASYSCVEGKGRFR